MKVDVVFDGWCGVCTRLVRKLKERDSREVLRFRPCQSLPAEGWKNITHAQCEWEVWAIADDGTVAAGADAMALILTALFNNRWPYRIARMPVIRQILRFGYRIVARNRRRLPGDKPWCRQHPEECRDDFYNHEIESSLR